MPESTTEIKGPATEAGRRLLSVPWASGKQAGLDLTEDVLAIEAEAAAAERAAIRAAVKGIYLPLGEDIGYSRARDRALNDVVELLDARQP